MRPTPGSAAPDTVIANSREQALSQSPRVRINTPRLHGSIALVGARLDDLTLASYHETVDPTSPEIVMLSPQGADDAYFAELGWSDGGAGVAVPGSDATWIADSDTLTQDKPVTLSWNNGQGLSFQRTLAVDRTTCSL